MKKGFTLAEVFCPVKQSKRIAFTLAEVLITLGIIGVVAALTMPSLIQNYQKQQTVTGLKRAYSVITQAQKLSEVDNGPYSTWEPGYKMSAKAYIEKYFLPYFKSANICETAAECGYKTGFKNVDGNYFSFTFAYSAYRLPLITNDGIVYIISVRGGSNSPNEQIFVDINGPKKPNQFGKDCFAFIRTNQGIMPNGYEMSSSQLDESCKIGAGFNYFCAAKIIKDGWRIADDYPWSK